MKVLLADDSALLRTSVSKLLVEAGYEVVAAEDGIEAIQRFYAEQPDLVLLDIQMPKMNGYVVCRLIKEDWSAAHVPVLILTARDSAEDRYWAQKSGADGFVTKEALKPELLPSIQSALASRALSELHRGESEQRSLDEEDVLSRVCDLLDRKLFEASIVNDIVSVGTRSLDLPATVGQALLILRRFVEYDLAGMALTADRKIVLCGDRPIPVGDLDEFRVLVAGHVQQLAGVDMSPEELGVWLVEGEESMASDEPPAGWPSFFAMPLRSRGEVIGVLAVGARQPGVFTEHVIRTLRFVEYPIAAVLDSARHYQRLLEQEARMSLSSLMLEE